MRPQLMKHVRGDRDGRDESPFLFAFRPGPRYAAMLQAYLDESGHPRDPNSRVVSVAAIVSTEKGWRTFSDKWNKILRRHKVSGLHMSEYENGRGDFSHWKHKDAKAIQFIGDLASILKNNIRFGCVYSLPMADWNETMLGKYEDPNEEKRGPLTILLQCCLEAINETSLLPRNQEIACRYEFNKFLAGVAPEHFKHWTKEWGLNEKFTSFTFAGKYDHPGLQGADMLAYEGAKHLKNQYVSETEREERKLHATLRLSKKIDLQALTREGLFSYLKTYYPHLLSDEETQLGLTLEGTELSLRPS